MEEQIHRVAERCGLAPSELVGRKCFELMHNTESAPVFCPHSKIFENGKPQIFEFYIEKLSGTFDITMSPVLNADGEITGTVHVARDISEKKRHEEQLESQKKLLERINLTLEDRIESAVTELREKDNLLIQQGRLSAMADLINSIAHHWRQPLNNIGLIVQSLQLAFKSNDLTVEELDAEISDTMQILQQISGTIDDFRSFFVHEKEQCPFSINEVVYRSIDFIMPTLKSKGIKIVCDAPTELRVVGYANEYAQVILNILINAKDAMRETHPAKPLITILIKEENGRSVVTIQNNGGVIPEDVLPKIFDPYFSTKGPSAGTGLGLYMAKMIIEKNMNGHLSVRNIESGTEFRIEL